jgi:hypothetical protein
MNQLHCTCSSGVAIRSVKTLSPSPSLFTVAQIYSDFIFKDVPFLVRWLKLEWTDRWKHEFPQHVAKQTAEYYFNAYLENWERPEVKHALETSAALMQWDDRSFTPFFEA